MPDIYDPALASVGIKAGLTQLHSNLWRLTGRPEVLLRVLDPALPLAQYGGIVRIEMGTASAVRIIGLAGNSVARYPDMGGALRLNYAMNSPRNGKVRMQNPMVWKDDVQLRQWRLNSVGFDKTTGAWSTANVTETLVMGWMTGAERGTIWQGTVNFKLGDEFANPYVWSLNNPSVIAVARLPYDIDWDAAGLPAAKTAFLASAPASSRSFFEEAWEYYEPGLRAIQRVWQPLMCCTHRTHVGATYKIGIGVTKPQTLRLNSGDATAYTVGVDILTTEPSLIGGAGATSADQTNAGATRAFAAMDCAVGTLKSSIVIPVLPVGTVTIGSGSTLASMLYDTVDYTVEPSNVSFPAEIDGLTDPGVFGHLFPGVYCSDSGITPTGTFDTNLLLSSLINIDTHLRDRKNVAVMALDGVTQLDATTHGRTLFDERVLNIESHSGNILTYCKDFAKNVNDRTIANVRAHYGV
jgi:hypothetical protein